MNETAIRKAISRMARSLVQAGKSESLFLALTEAAPRIAERHLRICRLERGTAGNALVISDGATGETLIEKYLFGEPDLALEGFNSLIQELMNSVPSQAVRPQAVTRKRRS